MQWPNNIEPFQNHRHQGTLLNGRSRFHCAPFWYPTGSMARFLLESNRWRLRGNSEEAGRYTAAAAKLAGEPPTALMLVREPGRDQDGGRWRKQEPAGRCLVLNNEIGAVAHAGLAGACAIPGDNAGAKAAYQAFLTLWKDADPDIPTPKQARSEYARFESSTFAGDSADLQNVGC